VYSQITVNLDVHDKSIRDVLMTIEQQSQVRFFYSDDLQAINDMIDIKENNKNIISVLDDIFSKSTLTYKVYDNNLIVIAPKELLQQQKITGTVTDEKGNPLPGVTVFVKGTTLGTLTDASGKYTINNATQDATLIFSFVGMVTQEILSDSRMLIDVVLKEVVIGLTDVVVIGYGTQKKVDLTGSVVSIKGNQIFKQPVTQISQALVGLTPGLTAIQSSGQPGMDNSILRIRGTGSIGASNDPLILIDGVAGDINSVNPSDIDDISILKDAASASIYGSRASNGVILITTKRAKSGELSLNYSSYIGWQKIFNQRKFVGALDYLKYSGATQSEIDNYTAGMISNPDLYPNTDWVKKTFTENGFQQYHDMTIKGGSERVNLIGSISYMDQGANIANYNYKRYNGRLNTDIKITKNLDINFDLSFDKSQTLFPVLSGDTGYGPLSSYIVHDAYRIPAIYADVYSDGSYGIGHSGENPVAAINDGGRTTQQSNHFTGVLRINYSPIKDFKLSVMYAPSYFDGYNSVFMRTYQYIIDYGTKTSSNYPDRSSLNQSNEQSFTNNFNALATYYKTFNNHYFAVLLGYELIKNLDGTLNASRQDFILQNYEVLNAGSASSVANSGYTTQSGLVSYFGRLNYSFKDKYLFEANLRSDASSRFESGHRESLFPSFSGGWRLSQEPFISDLGLFSNLKLRASWGELGNQQIGSDFPYASSISLGSSNFMFNNTIFTGAAQSVLANSNIKWETTETTNFGLDLGFFNQKLTLSAEYYIRKTKDILLLLPIPLVIGLTPSTQNAGNVENKGLDFTLGWQDDLGDFTYYAQLNFSDVINKVTNLSGVGPIINGNSITQVGSPIGSIYGYESVGIFQNQDAINAAPTQFGALHPGDIQYKDQNSDGIINSNDRVIIGDPFPRMVYGLNLGAGYKGFDLSVFFQGVGKRDLELQGEAALPLYNSGNIQLWQVRQCWSSENTGAKYPIIEAEADGANNSQPSSTWIFNASYFRMRNITLGYTLPKTLVKSNFVKGLRVYFSGQNLLTFDKLPEGIDPLIPTNTDGSTLPVTATFIIGVNVTF
jgi:TonB-linked SusC/RagA family outer membrane protein